MNLIAVEHLCCFAQPSVLPKTLQSSLRALLPFRLFASSLVMWLSAVEAICCKSSDRKEWKSNKIFVSSPELGK